MADFWVGSCLKKLTFLVVHNKFSFCRSAEALNEKIIKTRMIIAFLSMINNNSFCWGFQKRELAVRDIRRAQPA